MGVGDRRLVATAPVAHGAGNRPCRARSYTQAAVRTDPGDRAAARADGDDVDHRHPDREAPDAAFSRELGLGSLDQADVGRGAAGVDRDHPLVAGLAGQPGSAQRAGRRTRERGRDRLPGHRRGGQDAAVRLHDQQRRRGRDLTQSRRRALQVAGDVRLHEGVDQGGHRALVLAVLGPDLTGDRDDRARVLGVQDLAHPALVLGVGVGVQEADPDRLDAGGAQCPRDSPGVRLIEGGEHLTPIGHPLRNLENPLQGHDAVGLDPEVGIAIAAGHALAGDLEHVAEAAGGHQGQPVESFLEHGVGRHRGPVRHGSDRAALGQRRRAQRAYQRPRGVVGRAGDLELGGAAGLLEQDQVGKGASGIDADPQTPRHLHGPWRELNGGVPT